MLSHNSISEKYVCMHYKKDAALVCFYCQVELRKMNECEEFSVLEKLLLKHAGLMIKNKKANGICLQGPVKINDVWFYIQILCPFYPSIKSFQLQIRQSFCIKSFSNLTTEIPSEWSVEKLIEHVPFLVGEPENIHDLKGKISPKENFEGNIYSEIANLYSTKEYEIHLSETCSHIRFSNFLQNQQHFLEVALPSLQLLQDSLPLGIVWQDLLGKATSLTALVQQFKKYIEDLGPFYENFTDIDELCHVVQPLLPTTKENWRLFVLKDRVFLKLEFTDPFSPLNSMSLHIIGPTQEVTKLRRVYSEGLRDWDSELDVHKNLLRIFDLCYFPMPPTEDSESSLQFCNICYCFKLELGEIPIISCDNPHCSLIYHAACLKEWFNTLADGKTFLDVAFGACPFCKAKLSTSFQEILV